MTKIFMCVWFIAGAIVLVAYLLRPENRLVVGGVALLAVIVAIPFVREGLRRKREGFYVNTRGNADGGDVIYYENEQSLTFYFDRIAHVVYVPSDEKWEEDMPEWAKGRKIEISERIAKRMGNRWKFRDKDQ